MTRKELERLNADHPEWRDLSPAESQARYWMYFADQVNLARLEVHWRHAQKLIVNALTPIVDALAKFLNRFQKHT